MKTSQKTNNHGYANHNHSAAPNHGMTNQAWNGPNASQQARSLDGPRTANTYTKSQTHSQQNTNVHSPRHDYNNDNHRNQNGVVVNHNHASNGLYDNSIPNSTSQAAPMNVGASVYQSRQECVWSIKLFQQQDVASNFSCQTCCDVPRYYR